MNIIIYSKPNCGFCDKAEELLNNNNLAYDKKPITESTFKLELLSKVPDVRTVPQIFIDDKHIGGYTELVHYFANAQHI